ncbi:hypothetical protein AVEN_95946-1 [Araneus ventricosus]|uniref:Uncharacterized protein n=1 Tax=Araneus ventricosus TaxID=182803 RepID=A0A4Y2K0Y6_ARAVE|nr:hypothetical protein AVEN_95946-1 [Araneus ventricosus]
MWHRVSAHVAGNRKIESPRPSLASGILNDSGRYDSSSTEAGVLVTHHRAGGGAYCPTASTPAIAWAAIQRPRMLRQAGVTPSRLGSMMSEEMAGVKW